MVSPFLREFLKICLTSGPVLALLRNTLGAISRCEMILRALDRVRRFSLVTPMPTAASPAPTI
jgi:hypothetical protein